ASELGQAPSNPLALGGAGQLNRWRAELFAFHQNSVLNARSFFQVGPVQPAHQNEYGLILSGPLGSVGDITGDFSQKKVRGMVNGNVLVPLESERTPLATDPEVRQIIQHFLNAYPDALPNRTDFDPRALNTNAPQHLDNTSASLRIGLRVGSRQDLILRYRLDRQQVDAFQFVAGQNPDTEIHGHLARIAHIATLSPSSLVESSFRFQRSRSVLKPEPNAVGPKVRIGRQIQELGPDSGFPVDRALNTFTWGGQLTHTFSSGRHTLKAGGYLTRVQLNGAESNDLRGYFRFSSQFGRTALENFLLGIPSKYIVTIGDVNRGFRKWQGQFFVGDEWQFKPDLKISLGLRYGFEGRPVEVNSRNIIPYSCDCNNFAPRLGLAYRLSDISVLRASYAISFGEIFPVTYQQIRNNLPEVRQFQIQNPDLVDPLKDIDINDPNSRTSPTIISPDLVAPYSQQYSLAVERVMHRGIMLKLGYVGSRTVKPFKAYILNRAELVPGIPQLPSTIDDRRADPRYYETYNIANGGRAYFDAAQVTLTTPYFKGLSFTGEYTFSKAIDLGADYTSTAATTEITRGRDQWQYLSFPDKKGLSDFDSPHALVIYSVYWLPEVSSGPTWIRHLLKDWRISGSALLKTGTPFGLWAGSDSFGYGNVDGSTGDRPNVLDPSILGATVSHPDTSRTVLERGKFSFIRPGEVRGNIGRNTFRRGPITNLNLALSRDWVLGSQGEHRFQFRIEAYNVTNTPQFDQPERNLTSPSFGQITNTLNQGRIFQVGLRLIL
ncbi:MAG TPA: TonB-dependent receptor, partial [Acidobacteriota bacterium]|nr:TonB-dependent receptor [Acidobacteriota bacterium]